MIAFAKIKYTTGRDVVMTHQSLVLVQVWNDEKEPKSKGPYELIDGLQVLLEEIGSEKWEAGRLMLYKDLHGISRIAPLIEINKVEIEGAEQ